MLGTIGWCSHMALYGTDEGQPIVTQSMLKTFRSCPREAMYKYAERLQPKVHSQALTRGKWVHALLEAYYKDSGGEDAWELEHKRWCGSYAKLFDEEKEKLGDLPREIDRLMRSYLWHYENDQGWNIAEVEMTIEAELPNGMLFRGRIDMLVEDTEGRLWIVDHKTHKRIPEWQFRMLDEQSPLYVWAMREMDYPVDGFIWNYLSTAGISVPQVLKNGQRFSKRLGDTDYPTYAAAVRDARLEFPGVFGEKPEDKAEMLAMVKQLKRQRFVEGAVQTSPHFQRDMIIRTDDQIERVLRTTVRTAERMHSYDFSDPDCVERNVNACKGFMCSYRDLSMSDLLNGDSEMIKKRDYLHDQDPLSYYDGKEEAF